MKAACVIVTAGGRTGALARAVASTRAQEGVDLDVLVVANGVDADAEPPARLLRLPENLGPPGARNLGVDETPADVVFFLDDDAAFADPRVVVGALERFASDPSLGVLSFRIADPDGKAPQRRHVPRLRAGDPARSSEVTTFLEGACAIRRAAFVELGGYPESFRFGHEGTDLAWRALDAGYRIVYAADLVVHHPSQPPARHADFHYLTARNRVLLARRRLPWVLAGAYVLVWFVLGMGRAGSARAAGDLARGFRDGLREPAGERRPIKWRTVWRMTRLGRPPIV